MILMKHACGQIAELRSTSDYPQQGAMLKNNGHSIGGEGDRKEGDEALNRPLLSVFCRIGGRRRKRVKHRAGQRLIARWSKGSVAHIRSCFYAEGPFRKGGWPPTNSFALRSHGSLAPPVLARFFKHCSHPSADWFLSPFYTRKNARKGLSKCYQCKEMALRPAFAARLRSTTSTCERKPLSTSDPSADYNPKFRGRKAATNGKNRPIKKRRALRPGVCHNCGCTEPETTLWRSNPDCLATDDRASMLCNACGLWRAEHGFNRPKDYQERSKAAQFFSANTHQSPPFTSPITLNQAEPLQLETSSKRKRKRSPSTSTASTPSSW
ncbi:hypothetical protein C361_02068, partial [Cryptococcus neoformans Tu259-1]